MERTQLNSFQTNLAKQKDLYDKIKMVCAAQSISIKTAMREAMIIWLRKEQGDAEFTRYLAAEQEKRDILNLVNEVRNAKTIQEAKRILDHIITEY